MNSSLSVPRLLVDQALDRRNTTLEDFVDGGRKQGKTFDEIHAELILATGVDFSLRTFYRWTRSPKVSA